MIPTPEPTAVSAEALEAILIRHGLHPRRVVPVPHGGSGHSVYLLGDDLVLRVPRNHPLWAAAAQVEAIVVPLARAAGVRAPALLVFDDACDLLPAPYTIYERVRGETLYSLAPPPETIPQVWRELGHDLALLHTRVTPEIAPGRIWPLDAPVNPDPRPWAEELAGAGFFTTEEARWLRDWLERLTPLALAPVPLHFIHGDVQTMNIVVQRAPIRYTALLDWGGAGWSFLAQDFWALPYEAVPFVLAGYRAVAPLPDEGVAELRIAWSRAQYGLFFLWRDQAQGSAVLAPRVRRYLLGLRAFLGEPGSR